MESKKKEQKLDDFGCKIHKFKYTFEVSRSEMSNENKRLQRLDKETFNALKLLHYIPLYTSINMILDSLSNLGAYRWYHHTNSLSYLYDNCCVKAHTVFKGDGNDVQLYSDYLYQDFLKYCKYEKGMKRIHSDKMRTVCTWFVRNLNRAKAKGKIGIIYHKNRTAYQTLKDTYEIEFPYNVMHNLVEFLKSRDLVTCLTGYRLDVSNRYNTGSEVEGDPILSVMVLTGDLSRYCQGKDEVRDDVQLPCDIVQIRNEKKQPLPIKEEWKEEVHKSKLLLSECNGLYAESTIEVNGHVVPELWLKRIWTGDMDHCGRFFDYGQFQQFCKRSRATTKIDGEGVVSLDFNSLHPSMLYTMEGIKLDKDPYPKLNLKADKVLVNKFMRYYNLDKYNPSRNLCKLAMLCMINADSKDTAISAIIMKLYLDRSKIGCVKREPTVKFCGLPKNLDIHSVVDRIEKANKQISKYFYTGAGLKLMNKDSKIMEHVLRCAVINKEVVIPLHDESICKESIKDKVRCYMQDGYKLVMGTDLNCNIGEE